MAFETNQVVRLQINLLHPHPAQNPARTLNIASLMKDIKDAEGIMTPIGVIRDETTHGRDHFTIIHGHRRVAAAKKLGHDSIPCVILEGDKIRLFAIENASIVAHSEKDRAFAYAQIGESGVRITAIKNTLNRIQLCVGEAKTKRYLNAGNTRDLYTTANKINKLCRTPYIVGVKNDDDITNEQKQSVGKTIDWLASEDNRKEVKKWLRLNIIKGSPETLSEENQEKLWDAISQNKGAAIALDELLDTTPAPILEQRPLARARA